ncbi:hypothetical protein GHT06_019048 [Daphnia sinensis]|uniref:HAT C-terminal dimerisation domain-containing protein n=1 Tax=Daphnia sinensis TaxID=1820382 RepID=A0AAD5PR07_9CRUS|nr:hypothetical protein GHT06_019048 [Daphnia sinensis]
MLKAFKLFGAEPVINEPDSAEEDDCFNGEDVVHTDLDFELLNIDSEEELYRLPMHFPCAAHLLSLLAKADADSALSNAQFKKKSKSAIGKLQGIFNKQQRSSLSKDKIKELLGTLFVIPNDTRWNAWFDAIKHVHNLVSDLVTVKKVKSNLKAVCEFLKIPVLTSEDYLFISEYVSVMTPVSYALDVLQGEQHTQVSSGYLLPTIVVIRRRLAELALKEPPLAICKPLVEALQEGLSKRFDRFFKLEYFQLAAVLHPKFKLNWLDYQDEEDLKLKNQIITRIETKLKAIDAEKSSSLNKSVSPEDERDFFTLLSKGGKQENFSNSVWKMELSRYLESKNTAELSCLNQFPLIKQLFHYYNDGLPASAACERLFSLGGRILTPMRTLLGDINFEMLVFLRSNKKVVDSLAFSH